MAPSALAAPVASVSPAFAAGGGVRSARIASTLPTRHSSSMQSCIATERPAEIGEGEQALGDAKHHLLLGVDPLQAGNVVQLLVVLGMTVGWISTYMFRVANKDMTYAKQLRDYEKQKRLESLSEAELQALLEQVEEEKQRLPQIPEEPNAITFKKK
nr:unnamed protein product [Digitaria exilis]